MVEVRTARVLAALAVLTVLALTSAPPARAEQRSRPAPILAQADVRTSPLPSLAPPPDDRIVVAATAGTEERRAYVSVGRPALDDGETVEALTLTMASDGDAGPVSGVPSIVACRTEGGFGTGHLEDGPAPDCSAPIPGASDDADRWTFDLSPLAEEGDVHVALVADPTPGASWEVAFAVAATSATATVRAAGVGPTPANPPAAGDGPTRPGLSEGAGAPGIQPAATTDGTPTMPTAAPGGQPDGDAPTPATAGANAAPSAPDGTAHEAGTGALPGYTPDGGSGRVALPPAAVVLGAGLLGIGGSALRPGALSGLARVLHRRRKDTIMTRAELGTLNTRLRLAVGVTSVLVLVLVATVTSSTSGNDDEGMPLAAVDQPLSASSPAPSGARTASGTLDSPQVTGSDGSDASGEDDPSVAGTPPADDGQTGDPGAPNTGSGDVAALGGTSGTAPSGEGGTGATPNRTATDQGVTADTIDVATFVVDPAFYARFGLTDPEIDKAVTAYTEHVNAEGGINGRRLVPDLITISDPRDRSAVSSGCRTAFADHRVFMLANANAYPGLAECTKEHQRIATDMGMGPTTATPAPLVDGLGGRYWIAGMTSDRMVELWAQFLATTHGTDSRIGILQNQDENLATVNEQLQAALDRNGFDGDYSVVITEPDPSTAAVQSNNAIAQWRRDGVDLVVPLTNAVAMGILQRSATAQGWKPAKGWTFSSIAGVDSADSARFLDPSQMNGAQGIGYQRGPDEAEQAQCRDIYLRRYPDSTFHQETANQCHIILQNARVLRDAGPELTMATWAAAHARLGTYQGNALGVQTYGPDKRDGADQVRSTRFEDGTFSPTGPFRSRF